MQMHSSSVERPGIAFEKAVAAIQAQFDSTSTVEHNQILKDRMGHGRQFDVVVRGAFAGQQMLGVIECKDLRRKVGTPEVDAFITKAQDINANFKILMSRCGFSKQALEKCKHYGIQALSLITDDPANSNLFLGTYWTADITRWRQIAITLNFVEQPLDPVHFNVSDITIDGEKVLDGFTNYILDHQEDKFSGEGWFGAEVVFEHQRRVSVRDGEEYLCTGIHFMAERVCDKYEYLVGVSGTGFFDWQEQKATFPPGATIKTGPVPMDFSQWKPRSERARAPSGFLEFHLVAHSGSFERVPNAIDLDSL